MNNKYIAIIGDVIRSREIRDRITFDEHLLTTMDSLNKTNPHILSPYTLIGDEIQVVFNNANRLFLDLFTILLAIHPEQMRFSIGIGSLVKPINPQLAIEMDGPAFHYARDGIDNLKHSGYLFDFTDKEIKQTPLVKYSLYLISHNMASWNKSRLHTFTKLINGCSIKEIARELNLSDKAIYQTIKVGGLRLIINMLDEIQEILTSKIKFQS